MRGSFAGRLRGSLGFGLAGFFNGGVDVFRGEWQVQHPHPDGVLDGVGHGGQEGAQGAFACLLGAERSAGLVGFHDDGFDIGGFHDGRKAVVQQVRGQGQAVLVLGFLLASLGHAHPDRAFHLTLHRQGIEREPAVVGHGDLLHGNMAGVHVHLHLHRLGGITEGRAGAHARPPVVGPALGDLGGGIDALGDQRALIFQGQFHRLVEGQRFFRIGDDAEGLARQFQVVGKDIEAPRGGLIEQIAHALGGLDGRVADVQGHPAGVTAVVLGRDRAVRRHHPEARRRQADHLGGDLHHHGR